MTDRTQQRWSQKVAESSNALDLEPGVFALDDPRQIALSLKRSADQSERLEAAKNELRELYGRLRQKRQLRRRARNPTPIKPAAAKPAPQ